MFHRTRHTTTVTLSLCLAMPAVSHAQDNVSEARELVRRGYEARAGQRDREALEAFQRAYAIDPVPSTLAQQALAEQALGRWVAAEVHLTESLRHADDAWIASQRPALLEALRVVQEHLGTLSVEGHPVGARLFVDGDRVGTLPLVAPLRVPEGNVLLTVSLDGHYPIERRVMVRAGRTSMESVELHPVVLQLPVSVRRDDVPIVTVRQVVTASPVPWVFAGAGAALFGSSAALWALRGERESAVRELCAQTDDLATQSVIECVHTPVVVEAYGRFESMNAGMNVVLSIGSVATAVSLTWGVVDLVLRAKERRSNSAAISISVSQQARVTTLLVGGSF